MTNTLTRRRLFSLAAAGALTLGCALSSVAPVLAAGGQTGVISGTVVDAGNAPAAGADVVLTGSMGRYTAHTGTSGKFTLVGVLADTYTLTVRQGGVLKISQPGIGVIGDQTVDLGTIVLPAS